MAELTELLSTAVEQQQQVRLQVDDVPTRDESTKRVVDPLRVVGADGNTYLDAYGHLAEDQRSFRGWTGFSSAEALDTPVDRHTDIEPRDLADGIFRPSKDDLLVTLHLELSARWVAEYYPTQSSPAARAADST